MRLIALLLSALLLSAACALPTGQGSAQKPPPDTDAQKGRTVRPPGGNTVPPTMRPKSVSTSVLTEPYAEGLVLPSNLTFAPDGRLFLTEVSAGRVRIVDRGKVQPEPFLQVDPAIRGETGLLGLTLDPDFAQNRFVYIFYSQNDDKRPIKNRVVRYTDVSGRGADPRVILDNLPVADWRFNGGHNGGRLGFGPDGKLYVSVGDVGNAKSAQRLDQLHGKLLRINADGSLPADNPFGGSAVFALGLRSAWGLAFHPTSLLPYVTENGDRGHDEVNRVAPGGNFGHPDIEGIARDPRFIDPLWESGDEGGGISGMTFYTGVLFPAFQNDLLFCMFNGGRLTRLKLEGPALDQVAAEEVLSEQCHLDVTIGPEGAIYIATLNKIQRLVPAR